MKSCSETNTKTSAGEKYPVKKYLKRTEGKNTVTVTFTNVKKAPGTWYVTIQAWNQTSKDKSRAYSPYSTMKKFKTKEIASVSYKYFYCKDCSDFCFLPVKEIKSYCDRY